MIALYAAHPDEAGVLNWSSKNAQTLNLFRPADVSDLPSPASGLIGRQRELMRIGTQLLEATLREPRTVTLHGAGGIGKTALLWQSLLRFAPSFELTLAIALDPLPSLESVLGRIERFLGLPTLRSNDTQEREALVRNALTGKRTLLGLDNFDTLNYALNEKDSDEEKTAKSLHTFFISLAANGVTLCVTSREVTNLPGETIEEIQGLTNENGGRLFQENVVKQKDEIYIEKTQQVSEMVGGHPLALRLLASAFDDQIGTSLAQYIENLQSFLPKARDKWTEEDRHESLRASFDFTMNSLLNTEEGKELQVALSRLSVFIAFFDPLFVLPVIANKWPETDNEAEEQNEHSKRVAYALWERSLLERVIVSSEEENIYLYRLQPALSVFAKELLLDIESVKGNYWKSMSNLAHVAVDGVRKSPLIAQIALYAISDLHIAAESNSDADAALMQFHVSKLLQQFGMYNDALRLLEKSRSICETFRNQEGRAAVIGEMAKIYTTLGKIDRGDELQKESLAIIKEFGINKGEAVVLGGMGLIEETRGNLDIAIQMQEERLEIAKRLGNQSEISAAIHSLANIHVTRGELDEAMRLYQQSLEITENLGDLQGESAILTAMAEIYVTHGRLDIAMDLYNQSLQIKESLGDIRGKAITIGNLAKIHVIHGDLDSAMNLYKQSLDLFERLNDLQGQATAIGEIASIYVRGNNLDKGLDMQQEQLSIVRNIGNKKEEAVTLHNMAHNFHKRGDLEEAMNLYTKSLQIREDLGDQKGKSSTLRGMANIIYQASGNVDEAMRLYKQVLEIAEDLDDLRVKGLTLGDIGIILFQNQQYSMALRNLHEALTTLQRIGAHPDAVVVVSWLIKFQQTLGIEKFNALWQEEIGQPIPKWFTQ